MSSKATHCNIKDDTREGHHTHGNVLQSSSGPCLVVFVDEFAGYLPAKDLAEDGVPHLCCTARAARWERAPAAVSKRPLRN